MCSGTRSKVSRISNTLFTKATNIALADLKLYNLASKWLHPVQTPHVMVHICAKAAYSTVRTCDALALGQSPEPRFVLSNEKACGRPHAAKPGGYWRTVHLIRG